MLDSEVDFSDFGSALVATSGLQPGKSGFRIQEHTVTNSDYIHVSIHQIQRGGTGPQMLAFVFIIKNSCEEFEEILCPFTLPRRHKK